MEQRAPNHIAISQSQIKHLNTSATGRQRHQALGTSPQTEGIRPTHSSKFIDSSPCMGGTQMYVRVKADAKHLTEKQYAVGEESGHTQNLGCRKAQVRQAYKHDCEKE